MKKILLSFFVIGVVAVVAIGATRAWFTDQETVLGNTITAGSLQLVLSGPASTTFHVTGLMPSANQWTNPMVLYVENQTSSVPIKYRFYDRAISHTQESFYDHVFVTVWYKGGILYQGSLRGMTVNSTELLGVDGWHEFHLQFRLRESAGNIYQGASLTFDIVADATQVENPGWTQ